MAASRVALSIAANALLAGAKTVMSLAPLRVSPRPAAVTAVTSVLRAGLLEAAVATGSPAIPLKLPAPVAGTEAQAGPNGASAIIVGTGRWRRRRPMRPRSGQQPWEHELAAADGAVLAPDAGAGRGECRRR